MGEPAGGIEVEAGDMVLDSVEDGATVLGGAGVARVPGGMMPRLLVLGTDTLREKNGRRFWITRRT